MHVPGLALWLSLVFVGCGSSATNRASGVGVSHGGSTASSSGESGAVPVSGDGGGTTATGGWTGVEPDYPLPAAGSAGVAKPVGTPSNLTILNWAGFKGAVTYTFDDANQSQLDNYAALKALGVRMTFYLITDKMTSNMPSWTQVLNDANELGNHTVLHLQKASASMIDNATTAIEQAFGVRPWTFASPYGDPSYEPFAQSRFLVNRGVANALVMPNDNSDPFNLPCFIPPTSGTAERDFNPQIDGAESGGGWRIVLVHGFTGGKDSAFQPVSIDEFVAGVNHAKSLGDLWIDSMVNVAAYWRGQKALAAATPTTSGTTTTWTWTLPDNFPPNKRLRVRLDGGTLSQNGQTLEWDDHGYYEISLDVGTLTASL
jgi:peptidoglycan/xylan/chitin deacetylase (PgdA/CDA1 family)